MKIRQGYVSNSSSSSFVVVGYLIDDDSRSKYYETAKKLNPELVNQSKNMEDYINENGYETSNNGLSVITGCGDNGFEKGKTFIGKFIAKSDDDGNGMEEKIIEIDEIKDSLKEFDFLNEKIKIMTGTFYH
ncbi:MAG: hypothetical protein IKP65_02415 [Alphaproteobacteria bacterium]|nr:hypothetical protein [Alphaproteobacteria bacterium]